MENYQKGKNVEEPLEKNRIPIPNLPPDFLWMQVRGGSKINNLLTKALEDFPNQKLVVWTGFGPAVGKTVTCAEIMKREHKNKLHQITKLCYRLVEEYWDPILPELDQIVVTRKLPMIHICLSLDPLDSNELGYQAPGTCLSYKPNDNSSNKNKKQKNQRPNRPFTNTQQWTRRKQNKPGPSTSTS